MFLSILRKLSSAIVVYLMFASVAFAAITDLKLSTAQIFDVQWYISGGTLHASGFNYIYASVNYATQTASAARWTAAQTADANSNGRYIGFFNSTTNFFKNTFNRFKHVTTNFNKIPGCITHRIYSFFAFFLYLFLSILESFFCFL